MVNVDLVNKFNNLAVSLLPSDAKVACECQKVGALYVVPFYNQREIDDHRAGKVSDVGIAHISVSEYELNKGAGNVVELVKKRVKVAIDSLNRNNARQYHCEQI